MIPISSFPPRRATAALVAGLGTLALSPAQNTIVSPVNAAAVDGTSQNGLPWGLLGARRYQQIHGDLGAGVKMISKLAWRQNSGTANNTGTRAVDMEMFMANGKPVRSTTWVYTANYAGPATTVVARKIVNMGPQGQAVTGPNPFTPAMEVTLDAPYLHLGTAPLLWDTVIYGGTSTGTFGFIDADASSMKSPSQVVTGAGCVATGQTTEMQHNDFATDTAGTLMIVFTVTKGPIAAPAVLALGATNPNVTVPGLCGGIYTDLLAVLPLGVTDATGNTVRDFPSNGGAFIVPNTLGGGTIFSQVHALDAARTDPIGVSSSNGKSVTMPTPDTSKIVDCARWWNNVGGATNTSAFFDLTTCIGYGAVTQFTY